MVIQVIGTVNGQVNEGMRNIATHLSKEMEKDNTVLYSGLKQLSKILINSKKADVTLVFARANKIIYYLSKLVTKLCGNVWIVLVQKPTKEFIELNKKKPTNCNYLSITEKDLNDVVCLSNRQKTIFRVGIKREKFKPVSEEKKNELKYKYGYSEKRPLVIHVGHCSSGRGLEDFVDVSNADKLVVSSGMFEDQTVISLLEEADVEIKKGYIPNVEEIYQMADAYIFPTKSTDYVISIPLSVMEALACGIPVIGYRSFVNFKEIKCVDGAINLVDSTDEINLALSHIIKQKYQGSLLLDTPSWEDVAAEVLAIIREAKR